MNQGFEGLDGETPACVSDDILLTWAPCTRGDKGYEIEMWDLGLQEWVRVAATDDHMLECILSNILSGILYRFRVTAVTKDGNVSFPRCDHKPKKHSTSKMKRVTELQDFFFSKRPFIGRRGLKRVI